MEVEIGFFLQVASFLLAVYAVNILRRIDGKIGRLSSQIGLRDTLATLQNINPGNAVETTKALFSRFLSPAKEPPSEDDNEVEDVIKTVRKAAGPTETPVLDLLNKQIEAVSKVNAGKNNQLDDILELGKKFINCAVDFEKATDSSKNKKE